MNEQNSDIRKVKRRYCKKCGKEVMAIKEPKTPGKQVANFFAIITFGGQVYSYPKRCPDCGEATRATKSQRILAGLCCIIWISVAIIVANLT